MNQVEGSGGAGGRFAALLILFHVCNGGASRGEEAEASLKGDVCFIPQLLHLLPGGTEARDKLEAHQSRELPLTTAHSKEKKRDVFSSPVCDFSSNAEAGNKPKSVRG